MGMQPSEVTASRWGCGSTAPRHSSSEHPRHVIDQGVYTRESRVVALCGVELAYVEAATSLYAGDVASGRDVLAARNRSCRRCRRLEVDRGSDHVSIPVHILRRLMSGEPWQDVELDLDAYVRLMVTSAA